MEEFSVRGGVRVGLFHASWPLAKLIVSPTRLRLSALLGRYDFAPKDVILLERYGSIPVLWSGIRIFHSRPDYPGRIIFSYFGDPETLLQRIRDTGFIPASTNPRIGARGFSARWTAVLLFFLLWNGLFLLGLPGAHGRATYPLLFPMLALLLAFSICWGIRVSPSLQKMILKEGHSISEIQQFLLLIQIVAGVLLFIFAILLLTHAARP